MAWDRSGRYYYRSRWVNGRPVREYAGAGLRGALEARLDELERDEQAEKRAAERAQLHALEARTRPLDEQLNEVCSIAETLTRLALLDAGFRQHDRGHWRRRRHDA